MATCIMLWPLDPQGMRKEDVKAVYNVRYYVLGIVVL